MTKAWFPALALAPLAFLGQAFTCPNNPLALVEQGRWTVLECVTLQMRVASDMPSSDGNYWLIVATSEAEYFAKVHPRIWPIDRPHSGETVTITGLRVRDKAYPMFREILITGLVRNIMREYNERRPDGSWWFVQLRNDGTYRDQFIPPVMYQVAGITN